MALEDLLSEVSWEAVRNECGQEGKSQDSGKSRTGAGLRFALLLLFSSRWLGPVSMNWWPCGEAELSPDTPTREGVLEKRSPRPQPGCSSFATRAQ